MCRGFRQIYLLMLSSGLTTPMFDPLTCGRFAPPVHHPVIEGVSLVRPESPQCPSHADNASS